MISMFIFMRYIALPVRRQKEISAWKVCLIALLCKYVHILQTSFFIRNVYSLISDNTVSVQCMFSGYIVTNMLLHHIRRKATVRPAQSARVSSVLNLLSITDEMSFFLTGDSTAVRQPSVYSSDSNSSSSGKRSSSKVHTSFKANLNKVC